MDFLFNKFTSSNVIGNIKSKGDSKNLVIISAYIDSVKEFSWWKTFGNFGVLVNAIGAFGLIFSPFLLFINYYFNFKGLINPFLWIIFIISIGVFSILTLRNNIVVDGAVDNLSGIQIITNIGKSLSKNELIFTKLELVSFGSEEPGRYGSEFYIKNKNFSQYKNVYIINFDGFYDLTQIRLIEKEIFEGVKYSEALLSELERFFKMVGINPKRESILAGTTDGASFKNTNVKFITVTGTPSKKFCGFYHTRFDKVELIDPKVIEKVSLAISEFIKDVDRRV